MKKISVMLSVLMMTFSCLLTACAGADTADSIAPETSVAASVTTVSDIEINEDTTAEMTAETNEQTTEETTVETNEQTTEETTAETTAQTTAITTVETTAKTIDKQGSYTSPEDVAEYIHTFGTLPGNFITKDEAKALGWDSKAGNLWDVAPGKSIGGDRFGNYEGLLPSAEDRKYTECDVNYSGGYRGAERIIFSDDGLIYYTVDHYETFEQLY